MKSLRVAVKSTIVRSIISLIWIPAAAGAQGVTEPFNTPAAWQVWAQRRAGQGSPEHRFRRLHAALLAEVGMREAVGHTPTTGEALTRRQADCVGLALLLTDLGRAAGLDVGFVRLRRIERLEHAGGHLRLAVQHLAAAVADDGRRVALDFGGELPADDERVGDATAVALFELNRGAEALLRGDAAGARIHFARAIELDATLPEAWLNLGVALRRLGRSADAAAAYERVLASGDEPLRRLARGNLQVLLRLSPPPVPGPALAGLQATTAAAGTRLRETP